MLFSEERAMSQMPFIDREEELALIDRIVGEWGTRRVICIQAGGGVGKTRLLQEVRNRYLGSGATLFAERFTEAPVKIAVLHEFTGSEWSEQFVLGTRSIATEMGATLIER